MDNLTTKERCETLIKELQNYSTFLIDTINHINREDPARDTILVRVQMIEDDILSYQKKQNKDYYEYGRYFCDIIEDEFDFCNGFTIKSEKGDFSLQSMTEKAQHLQSLLEKIKPYF